MSKKLINFFLLAFIFRLVLAFIVWHPDVWSNMDWGVRFFEYGASGFFAPESNVWNFTWPNQPPGSILLYAGIRKLFEAIFAGFWFLNVNISIFPSGVITYFESNLYPALIQLPAILADLGISYLVYKILANWKNKKVARFGAILFLVNPIIWYNSAVWGQTDAVVNFFGLLAFYFLFKNRLNLSILTFMISLYIKVSLAIFTPIFVVVAWKKYCFKDLVKAFAPTLVLLFLVTLPFSSESGMDPFSWLYWLYTNKVLAQQLQVITANAFNIWATLTGILEQPHDLPFLGLTYQYWGYILFGLVFIPVLRLVWKKQDEKTVIWALAITAFSVWMLLTNMHERYLYPLFPYLTIIVVENRKLIPIYWLISGVSLLNLYNFWFTPRIEALVKFLSFGNRLMPRVFGLVNLLLFVSLYKRLLKKI